MPRDCLQDLTRLLHFVDDWELDKKRDLKWDGVFDCPKFDHDHDDYAAAQRISASSLASGWPPMSSVFLMVSFALYDLTRSKTVPYWCYTPFSCYHAESCSFKNYILAVKVAKMMAIYRAVIHIQPVSRIKWKRRRMNKMWQHNTTHNHYLLLYGWIITW